MDEFCPACGHLMEEHFKNVEGSVVCLHIETGQTTSGVIGLPFIKRCDCFNGTSMEAALNDREALRAMELTRQIKRVLDDGEVTT